MYAHRTGEKDELDVMMRVFGPRRSDRKRNAFATVGFQLNSQQISMSEDSEA
jgi:hypothetical protein